MMIMVRMTMMSLNYDENNGEHQNNDDDNHLNENDGDNHDVNNYSYDHKNFRNIFIFICT